MTDPRIVSLVPSATETVFALGAGAWLVGRSHACDAPREALDRPALTRAQLLSRSSRAIHDELRAHLSEGLAIYAVDLEALRTLAPTHLLVQDQCSVCAVSPSDLENALGEWLDPRPTLVRLAPLDLHDVWRDLETIGEAIGRVREARALRIRLAERLSEIAEAVGPASTRPRVACVEWLDPLMISGHWVPELVRIAGGEPLLGRTAGASTPIGLEALLQSRPDVVIVQLCGFDLATTRHEWQRLPAIGQALSRSGLDAPVQTSPRVVLTDGSAFFNRPGPRLVETAEILAEILHPTRFAAGHADRHFVPAPDRIA